MKGKELTIKQKIGVKALEISKKVAVRRAYKKMVKMSEKYRPLIDELQQKCADIIELEPEEQHAPMVATLCANIIQGFDTKEDMMMVLDMVRVTIEEYWKIPNIPQKQR